jgi:hypothetical protein
MIHAFRRGALLVLPVVLFASACTETVYAPVARPMVGATPPPIAGQAPTGMEGNWASNDGVFVASFNDGVFTSRFTRTNEILAQGTYQVSGKTMTLQWISVATQQQRAATCAIVSAGSVSCIQAGGGSFDLNRSI